MPEQWFLCCIHKYPEACQVIMQAENLSALYPNKFNRDSWLIWLPSVPRVGDFIQFRRWQVKVAQVFLKAETMNETGIKTGLFVGAYISVYDPMPDASPFAALEENIEPEEIDERDSQFRRALRLPKAK